MWLRLGAFDVGLGVGVACGSFKGLGWRVGLSLFDTRRWLGTRHDTLHFIHLGVDWYSRRLEDRIHANAFYMSSILWSLGCHAQKRPPMEMPRQHVLVQCLYTARTPTLGLPKRTRKLEERTRRKTLHFFPPEPGSQVLGCHVSLGRPLARFHGSFSSSTRTSPLPTLFPTTPPSL